MPVPVIVVGNITVGGTGKTPLVIWLVKMLSGHGYCPGVVSRGYGARSAGARSVDANSDPVRLGDEPVLLARRIRCPIWIGADRSEAALRLLEHHPEVNVIVADDGLQHYALARDVEIAVLDGQRFFGNGFFLPAGPLRESVGRLEEVDAVVINGGNGVAKHRRPIYSMTLEGQSFTNLTDPDRHEAMAYFLGRPVHALAGIGNPERFFGGLTEMGMTVVRHSFPDHYTYRQEDLPEGTLVMTEKDAVKCAAFTHPDAWVFAVDARMQDGLERLILNKLESKHGQQTA
jgi:tetraacyldisaccharide 4'-kinase